MDLVGYLVRVQMFGGDGFISTFGEHFGLWAVTKFGCDSDIDSQSGNTGTFRGDD
jgi:hypothetical protein